MAYMIYDLYDSNDSYDLYGIQDLGLRDLECEIWHLVSLYLYLYLHLSKAPQSGESATALSQKRSSTKNQGNIVAKIIDNTIENHSKIFQKTSNKII